MAGFFERVFGTVKTFFQIGNAGGPGINAPAPLGTVLEAKDPTNTTFVIMRGANPVGVNDLVTLGFLNGNPPGFLKQDGNSFGAELFAGTNDDFAASYGAFTAQIPVAFFKADPNAGSPVATVDVAAGGTVNIGFSPNATAVNVGNFSAGEVTTIQGTLLELTGSQQIQGIAPAGISFASPTATGFVSLNAAVGGISLNAGSAVSIGAPQTNLGPAGGVTQLLNFLDDATTNFVGFRAPAVIPANVTWTLPSADATVPGQMLTSNAAGILSWASAGTPPGAVLAIQIPIALATVSSTTVLPAGAVVTRCQVNVGATPYNIGATISVGQTGNVAAFQATSDNDPQDSNAAFNAMQTTPTANLAVLVTITGATSGSGNVWIEYAVPQN